MALLSFWIGSLASWAEQPDVTSAAMFAVVHKMQSAQHAKADLVESVTNRHLTSHGYWHSTSDKNEHDLVTQVEMTNDRQGKTNSVLLSVNHTLHLSPDAVKQSCGAHPKERQHPEPALKNITFAYEYKQSGSWTNFWFTGSGAKAEVRYVEITY